VEELGTRPRQGHGEEGKTAEVDDSKRVLQDGADAPYKRRQDNFDRPGQVNTSNQASIFQQYFNDKFSEDENDEDGGLGGAPQEGDPDTE